jgi:hypothetical protein
MTTVRRTVAVTVREITSRIVPAMAQVSDKPLYETVIREVALSLEPEVRPDT